MMIPGPTDLHPRVIDAMRRQMIDHRSEEFRELMRSLEERCKKVFETRNDVYVLTASGTGGVECAASNLVELGDKVLVPIAGVFGERMADAIEAYGGEVVRIELPIGEAPTPQIIKKSLEENPDVSIVGFPYNDTSTGTIARDLPGIIRACKEHGVLTVVDAVSILGGAKLPVDELGIDVCITGSQKCLAAPPGLALISFSEKALEKAEKKKKRPHYFDVVKYRKFLEERQETPFTPAVSLFFALDEALKIIVDEVGLDRWIERHQAGAAALYAAASELGVELFAKEDFRSPTVLAFKPPKNITDAQIRQVMLEKFRVRIAGGLAQFRGKMFRIANIGNVAGDRILKTIDALAQTLQQLTGSSRRGEALEAAKRELDKRWPG